MLTEKPESSYERDKFFTSANNAELAVIGIYNVLPTIYADKDGMAIPCSDDTYYINGTTSDNGQRDLTHYRIKTTNTWVSSVWEGKYKVIDRANYTISGIETMPGWQSDTRLLRLIAEARFLRAQSAFDLVRYWGDVPFKTEYTSDYESAYCPRTDREEIYNQIVDDLGFAAQYLPWADASSTPERASQGAARGMLMRVLLTRAGYSLRMNGRLERPDGPVRRACFQGVVDQWKAFEENGVHDFHAEGYEGLFKGFSAGITDNRESLFEVSFLDTKTNGVWGSRIGPAVAAPNISPSETGNYMGRANAMYRVVPEWKNFYHADDKRRDVAICTHNHRWDEPTRSHVMAEQKNPRNWYPGKWRREWMPLGYIDPNKTSVNFCVLRYADVVLMAAEAYAELGDAPTAWQLINRVRNRAGAPEVDSRNFAEHYKAPKVYDLPYLSEADESAKVLTALYWERGFELAFEGQRKFDLIRWGILADALKYFGEHTDTRVNGSTVNYPAGSNFVKGKHELLPIPLDELQSNSALGGINNPLY